MVQLLSKHILSMTKSIFKLGFFTFSIAEKVTKSLGCSKVILIRFATETKFDSSLHAYFLYPFACLKKRNSMKSNFITGEQPLGLRKLLYSCHF